MITEKGLEPGYGYCEPDFRNHSCPIHIHKERRDNSTEITPHWHNTLEFLYVITGHPVFMVGNSRFCSDPGSVVNVNTDEIHRITFENGPSAYYCISISYDYAVSMGFPLNDRAYPVFSPDEGIRKALDDLIEEYFEKRPYRTIALKMLSERFLLLLYRSCEWKQEGASPKKENPATAITKRAIRFIKDNYASEISTETVAKAGGVSLYHLCHCFKEVTGMTVIHYINFIRCNAAKTMLMDSSYTIGETAARCGFSGISYFSKTYSSLMGETPSQTAKSN